MGDLMNRLEDKIKECQLEGGEKHCTLGKGYYMHCPYNMCQGIAGENDKSTLTKHEECWLYNKKTDD